MPARIQVRDESNVIAYNAIAKRIMDEHHIPINDLHARVLSWGQKGADWQLPVNEHFRAEGYTDMATEVARYILAGSVAEMKSGPR